MKHLTPQQFIALLEGTPDAASRTHLDSCDACRDEVAELQTITSAVSASAIVPEPSPLFWNHFTARVRESVAIEPMVAPSWWRGMWRPLAGIGVALACVALVVLVRVANVPEAGDLLSTQASSTGDTLDASGTFVAQLASGASWEELQHIAPTTSDGAADMISSLTPAERDAFVRLLKSRPEGVE
jgi:hypothetical protein